MDEDVGTDELEGVGVEGSFGSAFGSALKSFRVRPKRLGRILGLSCFVLTNEGPGGVDVNLGGKEDG